MSENNSKVIDGISVWFPAILAFYLANRAITALLSPDFQLAIISNEGQSPNGILEVLSGSYIGNTVLFPIVLILTWNYTNRFLSKPIIITTLCLHFLAGILSVIVNVLDSGYSYGQDNYTTSTDPLIWPYIMTALAVSLIITIFVYRRKSSLI